MHRFLALIILLVVFHPSVGLAQYDPVGDLQRQDAALGTGCNEISVAIPVMGEKPLSPDQTWLDEHSSCVDGELLGVATCNGGFVGDGQLEICVFQFHDVVGTFTLECADFVLLTEAGAFGPEPQGTDEWAAEWMEQASERNLPETLTPVSCTIPTTLANATGIVAAFDIKKTEEPFTLRINVATGEFLAFLVTEPRQELPV